MWTYFLILQSMIPAIISRVKMEEGAKFKDLATYATAQIVILETPAIVSIITMAYAFKIYFHNHPLDRFILYLAWIVVHFMWLNHVGSIIMSVVSTTWYVIYLAFITKSRSSMPTYILSYFIRNVFENNFFKSTQSEWDL